jgi:hypothetical protein
VKLSLAGKKLQTNRITGDERSGRKFSAKELGMLDQ